MPTLFLLSCLAIGGSEKKTVRVANALHQRGLDIHIGYLNDPATLRPEINPAVPVVCLDRCGKFSWSTVRRLKAYVQMHRITRIVCVNLYPLLYVSALRLIIGRKSPLCTVSVNTTYFPTIKEASCMLIYAPLLWLADHIIFGCDFQLNHWVDKYQIRSSKCLSLYNGVDENYYSQGACEDTIITARRSLGLNAEDFVIGTVGQLRPEKQQRDLIIAVQRLRAQGVPATALIVGAGPEEDALRKLKDSLGMETHVRLIGKMKDVRPALIATDVFVLTSLSETFSNAALEAMAMGRPVVLSDAGGAREMVWEGVNGFLFSAGDVTQLTSILNILANDVSKTQRMGEQARRIAAERFSFACMVEKYNKLFMQQ